MSQNRPRELTPSETAAGERYINAVDLTATQLQALVREMDNSKKRWTHLKANKVDYEEKLQEENTTLYYNYPSLFQMHAEDRLDTTFFDMLALKRKIEKGEITPEQATQIVGQKLSQRFVPSLATAEATAPRMSYEDFYKSSNSK
jgi:hypothetical protein